MEEFLKNLGSNPWFVILTFIGTIASIIAIPIAIYFYLRQKKEKTPLYAIKSITLVKGLGGIFENVKVIFNKEEVPNLTVTNFAFWNNGRKTIYAEDVADVDKIMFKSSEETTILDAKIVGVNNSINNFKLLTRKKGKLYELTFDFIDYKDAVVIQIIHNGINDYDLEFCGTIKGAGKIREKKIQSTYELKSQILSLIFVAIIVLSAKYMEDVILQTLIIVFLILIIISITIYSMYMEFVAKGIPKWLRKIGFY